MPCPRTTLWCRCGGLCYNSLEYLWKATECSIKCGMTTETAGARHINRSLVDEILVILLGMLAKFREVTVSFVMSVRLSVRTFPWNNSASTMKITTASLLESPRRRISEDVDLHEHRCENLKTLTIFSFYLTVVVITYTNSSLLALSQNCKRRLLASSCLSVCPSFLPSACLSVRMNSPVPTGRTFMKFYQHISKICPENPSFIKI